MLTTFQISVEPLPPSRHAVYFLSPPPPPPSRLSEPINIFFGVYKTDNAPIRLSYHAGVHYNSVVNPFQATIGVGLGLAGHKPGVSAVRS